jgi:hypothetical protein
MVSTFFILVVLCKGSYHNQWWVRNGIKFSIILHSSRTQKHNIKQVLIDRQASMAQAARNVKKKTTTRHHRHPSTSTTRLQRPRQSHISRTCSYRRSGHKRPADECNDDVFVLVSMPMLVMRTLTGCNVHDRLRDPHCCASENPNPKSTTCAKNCLVG